MKGRWAGLGTTLGLLVGGALPGADAGAPVAAQAEPRPSTKAVAAQAEPRPSTKAVAALERHGARQLQAALQDRFPPAALEALAEPLSRWLGLQECLEKRFAGQQALVAQCQAEGSLESKRAGTIMTLLAQYEVQGRMAFLQQANEILFPTQEAVLKALAASHARLLGLPATKLPSTSKALADHHFLLLSQRQMGRGGGDGALLARLGYADGRGAWEDWRS